jgi:hypothetical protein
LAAPVGMEASSMHWPQGPVCQWYTVHGCSLQLRTSCRELALGHWMPPGVAQRVKGQGKVRGGTGGV